MSVVVILSAALNQQERAKIASLIGRYGECVPLSESSYALHTDLSAEQISADLKCEAGIKEGVYAVQVKRSYRGPAPARVRQWLKSERSRTDAR